MFHKATKYGKLVTTSPHSLNSYCHNLREHTVVTTVVFGHSTVVNSICSAYLWNVITTQCAVMVTGIQPWI